MADRSTQQRQASGKAAQGGAPRPQRMSKSQSKSRAMMVIWVSVAVGGLLIISLPTVMVFFFGMLPTIVAWIVDRSKEKYATFCVMGMNLSGVFPSLLDLWSGSHTIAGASEILTDVFSLVVMYGSASFGWMLYTAMPPMVASVLNVMAQRKVSLLRAQQRKLIEEWGEAVSRPANGGKNKAAPASAADQGTEEAAAA